MIEFIIEYYSWLAIAALVPVWFVVAEIEFRLLKLFHVDLERHITLAMTTSIVLSGCVVFVGAMAAEPFLQQECCRARVTAWLTQSPAYSTLIARHPEAKSALVSAGVKMGMGGANAPVGQIEFSAVLNHYLRVYLPVTSDAAAQELVMAATAMVDAMLQQKPDLCIDLINGQSRRMAGKLPPHVFARYGNAVGRVITDGIQRPLAAPDPSAVRWQQRQIRERMARDGNPLAIDPKRLMNDPNRACFALLAIFDAVSKTVPTDEIGAFLRGTIPEFLKDDEA